MSRLGYESKLWIDQSEEAVVRKLENIGNRDQRILIEQIIEQGFCVINGAVPHEAIDRYLDVLHTNPTRFPLKASLGRDTFPIEHLDPSQPLVKILDTHQAFVEARNLSFSPAIHGFLNLVFEEPVFAFQSLHFQVGSTQDVHQDAAYVVIDQPNHFMAAWIALEDIEPGSGELVYYPRSHRFPNFLYGKNKDRKYWDPDKDGYAIHDHHLFWLHEVANERGLKLESFRPKKGDVLVWHSDLAHGGGPVTKPGTSRRSLVTHYCPKSGIPHFLRDLSPTARAERIKTYGPQGVYASWYYE